MISSVIPAMPMLAGTRKNHLAPSIPANTVATILIMRAIIPILRLILRMSIDVAILLLVV